MIHHGDSLEILKTLDANSVDAVVTDSPYGLKFMSKKWDYDVPSVDLWREVLRVLKPGGHLLSFGGTRTYHRMVVAIEDAGFEVRDQIMWIYGSGFPKSLDVSKAIDKAAGAKREVVGKNKNHRDSSALYELGFQGGQSNGSITAPATPEAKQWQGWGTALKPANEPIVLARKPLSEKTVAKNVLRWGTGALNIDASRIEAMGADKERHAKEWDRETRSDIRGQGFAAGEHKAGGISLSKDPPTQGRWPANVLFDEEAAAVLDEQSGSLSKQGSRKLKDCPSEMFAGGSKDSTFYGDSGGASRFFKVIKQDQYDIFDRCVTGVGSAENTRSSVSACASVQENVPAQIQPECAANNLNAHTSAPTAASNSKTGRATKKVSKSSAQECVTQNTDSESLYQSAPYAGPCAENTLLGFVHEAVKTNFKNDPQLLQCLDSIPDSKKCILYRDLALTVVNPASIDTTAIIQSCLKLFGSVPHAIASNTPDLESVMGLDSGPTRFLYQAKASKRERNAGLEGMPERASGLMQDDSYKWTHDGKGNEINLNTKSANHHPTVKPIKLMEYLCKLVCPPNGTVLDPFAGSGTTGVAAKRLGFEFVGIEKEKDYVEIARKRIGA